MEGSRARDGGAGSDIRVKGGEETAHRGNVGTAVIWEASTQTGTEWRELLNISEESSCDKKNHVPEEMVPSETPMKGILKDHFDIESTKD